MMDDAKLQVIKELMDELQEKMEFGKDDFEERLGRKKPDIEVMKVEGSMDHDMMDPEMEHEEEESGIDLDGDMEMGESPEHAAMVLGKSSEEPMSPEEKLKQRLLKLRG